jgi:hypothetical protein
VKTGSGGDEVMTDFRSLCVIRCTLRGRAVEFVYDEGDNGAPLLRDQRTGKRLGWRLTTGESDALEAYIAETPAQRNARLGS